ncbi:class I SAM-dependent methyltransferase [Allochromatium palmeri]|uniref:Methyltransferase domain-containing protein n=1 Tax=Allochromatium palmeri TaxID=231048 RepID=A0A6N8EFI4_9GAMM|nr:class I SAM-dependent methyltransferase [Allochromatium palmeri]MTW23072.1 methyltransferase domain-containing protein [Allochromatium palmeri]
MDISKWKDVWERFSGNGVYPHELAFILDSPLRNLILPASRLVDRLHLSSASRVLEIGPGPGYFSAEVVRRIPAGQLVLFDIQREMLNKSRAKLERKGYQNFGLAQGSADRLPFKPESFDVVFLVTVLGEVQNPSSCVANISQVLRPRGVLSLTEQAGDPDALAKDELKSLGEAVGLHVLEHWSFRGGFTLNLVKMA